MNLAFSRQHGLYLHPNNRRRAYYEKTILVVLNKKALGPYESLHGYSLSTSPHGISRDRYVRKLSPYKPSFAPEVTFEVDP